MNQNLISVNAMVSLDGEKVVTTSHQVAKYFGKRHDNVILTIEKVECSMTFAKLNFEVCYKNSSWVCPEFCVSFFITNNLSHDYQSGSHLDCYSR